MLLGVGNFLYVIFQERLLFFYSAVCYIIYLTLSFYFKLKYNFEISMFVLFETRSNLKLCIFCFYIQVLGFKWYVPTMDPHFLPLKDFTNSGLFLLPSAKQNRARWEGKGESHLLHKLHVNGDAPFLSTSDYKDFLSLLYTLKLRTFPPHHTTSVGRLVVHEINKQWKKLDC